MTDLNLLKQKFDESGMTMVAIAEKTGIKRETLYNRFNGIGEFTVSEIMAIVSVFRLTKAERDRIFFATKVESDATEKGD